MPNTTATPMELVDRVWGCYQHHYALKFDTGLPLPKFSAIIYRIADFQELADDQILQFQVDEGYVRRFVEIPAYFLALSPQNLDTAMKQLVEDEYQAKIFAILGS